MAGDEACCRREASKSLENALKLIGLISHGPLLQHAVPTGCTILKAVGGGLIEKRAASVNLLFSKSFEIPLPSQT